ncbi:hypothetical protein WICANDRAFT_97646, partial [Wickerhamomyces anomalus NRRL Y-366-8]
ELQLAWISKSILYLYVLCSDISDRIGKDLRQIIISTSLTPDFGLYVVVFKFTELCER